MSQNITLIYCTIRKILQISTPYFFETPGIYRRQQNTRETDAIYRSYSLSARVKNAFYRKQVHEQMLST